MKLWQTALRTTVVLGVLCLAYIIYKVHIVLLLLLMAILLSAAIEPMVFWLRRKGATRSHSILLIYLFIATALGVGMFFGQHVVLQQIQKLIKSYPTIIHTWIAQTQKLENEFIRSAVVTQLNYLAQYETPIEALGVDAADMGRYAVLGIAGIVTVFVMCYYWLTEKPLLRRVLLTWASEEKREIITTTWNNVESKLGGWVRGELILCTIIGVGSFVGYMLFGVEYAFMLAVLAGITEIIPVVGPYIGIIPAVLIASLESVGLGFAVFIYGMALQFIENNFLVPRIMGKSVGLTPLSVMLALMIGGTLFGVLGALLSVPVAAAITALMEDLVAYHERKIAKANAPDIIVTNP